MIKTLKEAIEHARFTSQKLKAEAKSWQACAIVWKGKAKSNECLECAADHEQLAAWLEELAERREADRWRPVSEPPKKEGKCFVFTDYGDVTMDSFVDGVFVCNLGNVTHWKPLPKAPESEDQ